MNMTSSHSLPALEAPSDWPTLSARLAPTPLAHRTHFPGPDRLATATPHPAPPAAVPTSLTESRETRSVRAKQRALSQRLELERQRRLEESLGFLAHEMSSPLTATLGAQGLLLDGAAGELSSEQRELVELAQGETMRLSALIDELRLAADKDAGHLRPKLEALDLSRLLEEALLGLSLRAEAQRHRLVSDVDVTAPVEGDPEQLRRLVDNLVANAIKYTPEGGRISVRLDVLGQEAQLSVTDSGPGIAASELGRLFERFFRSPATADLPGSGLGLALCKAIADTHGGRLEVESAVGVGSTFRLSLPLAA